jgi:hypothetical protein
MKKIAVAIILLALFISVAGCRSNQNSNTALEGKTTLVKIDSSPEGAEVFVDNYKIGQTPVEYKLPAGTHAVLIKKDGFEHYYKIINVTNDKKEQLVTAILNKELLKFGEVIHFTDNLIYSSIYLNDTVEVSGYTVLDSFDIVFPSGKKAHFDTEGTTDKDPGGRVIRKFSKSVLFDEIGEYRVMHNGKIITPTAGGYVEYKFKVLYKAKVLNGTTLGSLNGDAKDDNKVLLPIGESLDLKLLLTDGSGNIARNKPIGLKNLKTDDNGVVSIKIKSGRIKINESPFSVYGDIICWICEYTTFDSNGSFIKARSIKINQKGELVQTVPEIVPQKVSIKIENGHIYMPFDCSGLSLCDLGFQNQRNLLLIHPKNPSIIYTNSSVSKDGGKTFESFGKGLSFSTMAMDPNHPGVIYGWLNSNPFVASGLLKSADFGKHFTKVPGFKFVVNIVIDPKNSKTIYVTTEKELLKSIDSGKTWKAFFSCPAVPWINPHNSDVILTTGCNFAGTTDGGKTWDDLNFFKGKPQSWNKPLEFAFDPVNPDVVYGITYSHFFKSEDNGKNWKMPTSRYFSNLQSIAIDQANPQKIYLGYKDGVLESDNGGKSFKNVGSPVPYLNSGFNASVFAGANGTVYSLLCGIPFKMAESGNWIPLNSVFLKGGPDWKVMNGVFYVDVKAIKSRTAAVKITEDEITFYRLFYIGP